MKREKEDKAISYKEIALEAGTSISTISRFYNNGYVSKDTKIRIQEIVDKNNYYPNHGARLIRGRDNSVFVIMPTWSNNIYNSIVGGIIVSCTKQGKRVNATYTNSSTKDYIEAIRYALSWKPIAIVIFIPDYQKEVFSFLEKIKTETSIIIYGHKVKGLNWIKPDLKYGFYEVTNKLFKNHKVQKLSFINDARLSDVESIERQEGFRKFCDEHKLDCKVINLEARKDLGSIVELNKQLKALAIRYVVCSTHETFITISTHLGTKEFKLTDIGYQSIYDNIKNYDAKIFIDYPNIGLKISQLINEHKDTGEPQERVIPTRII
ncbi:LacI family DNA-binding transcriptional regulator [Mycoplasma leonicaptivi]|uniref:LacI family DNA-binding transcriptional regulator n=1 Tax=Mycoplasma leonicaptivi TaxID=36742 RepID=UPI000485734D|nr:LacI family DNA-binding transcriptional regulator [Mycoplasma leonicaptivi]